MACVKIGLLVLCIVVSQAVGAIWKTRMEQRQQGLSPIIFIPGRPEYPSLIIMELDDT